MVVLGKLNLFIEVEMDGSFRHEKSFFKMLELFFCPKLDWSSYIVSDAGTVSKKTGVLICSAEFLSFELALYL